MNRRNSGDLPARPVWEYGFDPQFLDDLEYWITINVHIARHLVQLMQDIARDPFTGRGLPEPLKLLGGDIWSHRLTQEHRIVYQVSNGLILFLRARSHYD